MSSYKKSKSLKALKRYQNRKSEKNPVTKGNKSGSGEGKSGSRKKGGAHEGDKFTKEGRPAREGKPTKEGKPINEYRPTREGRPAKGGKSTKDGKPTQVGKPTNKVGRPTGEGKSTKVVKPTQAGKPKKQFRAPDYNFERFRYEAKKKNVNSKPDENLRLNRYLANAGICSRREADQLISEGKIQVNGKVVYEMGLKVKRTDEIRYKGKPVNPEKLVYILMNKPKDCITTRHDPHGRKTVMDLVANAGRERVYPVGRLDRNTTGLLLLTNDGDLAKKLAHPSHKVKKLYQVDLDQPLTNEDLQKIREGIMLEDGMATVDQIGIVDDRGAQLGVELHIGKNRIVRRIFEHLGYDVIRLDRVMYAGLDKKQLPRGKWRYLKEKEVINLKYFQG